MPDMTFTAFLAIAFMTGLAGALQLHTLSLFLSQEVQALPFMVGLFYTYSTIIGIFVSQFLAARSDKQNDRKRLIFRRCFLGSLGCVLFAYDRNYYLLLSLGVLLTSFGSTANPQPSRYALLFAACTFMWTCNCMYLIKYAAVYPLHELHLPEKTDGVMMGTRRRAGNPHYADGLLTKRWGKGRLIRLAVAAGSLDRLMSTIE